MSALNEAVARELSERLGGDYAALLRVTDFMRRNPQRVADIVNAAIERQPLVNNSRCVPKGVLVDAVLEACAKVGGEV